MLIASIGGELQGVEVRPPPAHGQVRVSTPERETEWRRRATGARSLLIEPLTAVSAV